MDSFFHPSHAIALLDRILFLRPSIEFSLQKLPPVVMNSHLGTNFVSGANLGSQGDSSLAYYDIIQNEPISGQIGMSRPSKQSKKVKDRSQNQIPASVTVSGKRSKKKKGGFRKAKDAPRRFKSPYIFFSISKMAEYKAKENNLVTDVTEISRLIAKDWKSLPKSEREKWDQIALQDKMRYNAEKRLYTGPWQVPSKRLRKDPSAPKRPPSAFLLYCQTERKKVRDQYPGMQNTDISKLLGKMWKESPLSVRQPHIDREQRERETYKKKIAKWRQERKDEELLSRKKREAVAAEFAKSGGGRFPEPGDLNLPPSSTPIRSQPPPGMIPHWGPSPPYAATTPYQHYSIPYPHHVTPLEPTTTHATHRSPTTQSVQQPFRTEKHITESKAVSEEPASIAEMLEEQKGYGRSGTELNDASLFSLFGDVLVEP